MFKRFVISLAALALGIGLVAPTPAFARMHFTDTNNRLDALVARANSAASLTNATEIQNQAGEIVTLAQAVKAAADEAAQRPASGAEDKSVLAKVGTDMDTIVSDANKAKTATGADQQTLLKGIQTRAQDSSKAVKDRIVIQQQTPAASPQPSPSVLPRSGDADASSASGLISLGVVLVLGGFGLLGLTRLGRSA
ncbi:MAG: hypothetical protein U0893_21530 [Chloroflexota bacterium]